jgi:putative glutamine amidotransferase
MAFVGIARGRETESNMEEKSGKVPGPRVGVTWATPGERKSDNYIEAIRRAGGEPVILPVDVDSWAGELEGIHGLLLTGGGDVHPDRYAQEDRGTCDLVDERRDRLELEAIAYCRKQGLPILGICRGFQVINVALGGSLLQDVETERTGALPHRSERGVSQNHSVQVRSRTQLARILRQDGEVAVNSRHHQGLSEQELAPGLTVNAMAPDGIVEGFELEGEPFLVGVQCHPERTGEAEAIVPVFDALVAAARRVSDLECGA